MRPDDPITLSAFGAALIAFAVLAVIWGLIASRADHVRAARRAEAAIEDLAVLDPAIWAVFGYQSWQDDSMHLDGAKLKRLADAKRASTKRAADTRDLDAALADMAAAREENRK
ncbi:hypothetical protein HOU70_gp27 [Arthrobacter phage Liebe]|uniref:Membrane protein n=2 Tax=Arthrobacter virus Liebe TaxID=2734245 RepID=A0A3G2KHR3_9CAUD|nr:hypothetical protein HOU70_gp27 [Arthrobacter phage Liebe]AYN58508.1 membrane protein [Arthrobacter phage Maureen]AZF93760.1 membrane protein [Arthrobacter phage Liebe]